MKKLPNLQLNTIEVGGLLWLHFKDSNAIYGLNVFSKVELDLTKVYKISSLWVVNSLPEQKLENICRK